MEFVALGVAGAFVALNGRNDGGALLAAGITRSNRRALWLGLVAGAAMAVAPLVIGTKVAEKLASGIVPIQGRIDLLIVVVATTSVVVAISAKLGFATSIGLALVGALFGVGVGAGLEVDRGAVLRILLLAVAAPLAAAVLGRLVSVLVTEMPYLRSKRQSARILRGRTYLMLCLAYGANDGQKALAVIALAAGADLTDRSQLAPIAIVSAALFLGGMLIGGKPVAIKTGRGMARAYPIEIVTANAVASLVVVGGATLGTPLSMTQAISGATVGVTSRTGWGYIRWPILGRLVTAWVLTFPLTALVAGLVATVIA